MKKQRLTAEPELNQEIFEEILSRLPVKSLLRLKSVCKSWKNLISESRFTKLHIKQSIDHNRSKLIYLRDFSTTLAYKAKDGASTEEEDDECSDDVNASVLAYCNGLFCISIRNDAYLRNPSTKESRKIADSAVEFPASSASATAFFGLGYCSEYDDYKLVRISMFDKVDPYQAEVKIYSRNSGTWRRIGDFSYDLPDGCPGVFANGSLHWIVWTCENGDDRQRKVAKLDLKDKSYGLVRLPEFGSKEMFFDIGSLDEKLIVFYTSVDCTSSIWILEEHGRVESWTRIKIAIDSVSRIHAFMHFQPLCFLEPGKILVRLGAKNVATFDVKKKQCYDVHLPYIFYFKMVSYVESLVSPYSP